MLQIRPSWTSTDAARSPSGSTTRRHRSLTASAFSFATAGLAGARSSCSQRLQSRPVEVDLVLVERATVQAAQQEAGHGPSGSGLVEDAGAASGQVAAQPL